MHRAIQVTDGRWSVTPHGIEARWRVRVGWRSLVLRTEIQGLGMPPRGAPSAEAACAAALLVAMRSGRDLCGPSPSSIRFMNNLPRIQETLNSFFDVLRPVRVCPRPPPQEPGGGTGDRGSGVFLSLGVDSFFTWLRHRQEIDHVVLVQGFDIGRKDDVLWSRARDALLSVAERTGTHPVLVRTNIRRLLNRYLKWDVSHGAALAHVALLLTPWLRRVFLASSHHVESLFPYGSHPDLDPLWGTEALELLHDGCDTRRIDKVRVLTDDPVAMKHLRVCWKNPAGVYNCGFCRKCVLVRLALDAAGALDRCATLPSDLRPEQIDAIPVWGESGLLYLEEIRDAYQADGGRASLLDSIHRAIARERTPSRE